MAGVLHIHHFFLIAGNKNSESMHPGVDERRGLTIIMITRSHGVSTKRQILFIFS
jgi:hypothetical protein